MKTEIRLCVFALPAGCACNKANSATSLCVHCVVRTFDSAQPGRTPPACQLIVKAMSGDFYEDASGKARDAGEAVEAGIERQDLIDSVVLHDCEMHGVPRGGSAMAQDDLLGTLNDGLIDS